MISVDLLDPPAYSLPYDDALAGALVAAGAQVRLLTSEFAHGDLQAPVGYERIERFYRTAAGRPGSRLRTLSKLAVHLPDLISYRRSVSGVRGGVDIAHFQWLGVPEVDLRLLPRTLPVVVTIHDPLRRGRLAEASGRLLGRGAFDRVDAVVVHSRYARDAVIAAHGLEPERVHVIRHGATETSVAGGALPAELGGAVGVGSTDEVPGHPPARDPGARPPVVLCFGLIRPYKGVPALLDAWREVHGAELWITGRPMMDVEPLIAAAPPSVKFVPRFISPAEEAALFAAADIVVLPYERSERFGFSGVLARALADGKAIVCSDVGGFHEVGELGAARLVGSGDVGGLAASLQSLIDEPGARAALAARAAEVAREEFSWAAAGRQTLELYQRLLGLSG